MKYLRLAFGLMTVVPMRRADELQPGDLGRAAVWYPLVGLVVGGVTALAGFLLGKLFPPLLAAALTLAVWVSLSGGLHLDGLADCCDALLGSAPREKRLEILRDPRLGTFGGLGLALFLILKFAAVVSLLRGGGLLAWALPFLLAASLGRWLALLAASQPMARPGGMGADMALGMTRRTYLLAAIVPLLLVLAAGWRGLAAALVGHLVAWGIFRLARARLGGVSGDVMGLTIEAAELATLLVFAAVI
jgi:adenosylcobinamide-GDP ribazoletransferase